MYLNTYFKVYVTFLQLFQFKIQYFQSYHWQWITFLIDSYWTNQQKKKKKNHACMDES